MYCTVKLIQRLKETSVNKLGFLFTQNQKLKYNHQLKKLTLIFSRTCSQISLNLNLRNRI